MLTFTLKGRDPQGLSCLIEIAVSSPSSNKADWCCEIVVFGIPSSVKAHIFGANPLQAYCLATTSVYYHLEAFTKEGGELYYADGTLITLTPDMYFPHYAK
jgi:hypothetical protein